MIKINHAVNGKYICPKCFRRTLVEVYLDGVLDYGICEGIDCGYLDLLFDYQKEKLKERIEDG